MEGQAEGTLPLEGQDEGTLPSWFQHNSTQLGCRKISFGGKLGNEYWTAWEEPARSAKILQRVCRERCIIDSFLWQPIMYAWGTVHVLFEHRMDQ